MSLYKFKLVLLVEVLTGLVTNIRWMQLTQETLLDPMNQFCQESRNTTHFLTFTVQKIIRSDLRWLPLPVLHDRDKAIHCPHTSQCCKQGWRKVPEKIRKVCMRIPGGNFPYFKFPSIEAFWKNNWKIAFFKYENEAAYPLIHCAEVVEVPGGVESARTWLAKVATWRAPKTNIIPHQNKTNIISLAMAFSYWHYCHEMRTITIIYMKTLNLLILMQMKKQQCRLKLNKWGNLEK